MRVFVEFSTLTDEERQEFVEGFKDADIVGVNDWETSTPWGAPWEWSDGMLVPCRAVSAYEMGRKWFEKNRSAVLACRRADGGKNG